MPPVTDRAHDFLREREWPLGAIFAPRSVAVIGATEAEPSVGRTLLRNLTATPFGGGVFPVNPRRKTVLGIECHPRIADVPGPVDLAVVVTPARTVPGIIAECVAAGVKGAVIISAGFKELGPEGAELERQVRERAREGKLRIIGPNCLGVVNPTTGLNASFAAGMALPGKVGFLSQSGALCTAILDWSLRERVGFSAFVSVGSMVDVGWGDLIDYLGDDPHTQSIVIYMESVGDARSFLSAAREVALTKPIILLKAGRTEQAARAAASHTGSLTGSDDVLRAALRRSGVLRVDTISELFDMAEVLAKQPRPRGPRLTILTNAGGPGVLATDALVGAGGKLAELAPETLEALDKVLPPHWSRGNPIDILGDAGPDRFASALAIAARDPGSDGLLVVVAPQDMTDPGRTAECLRQHARGAKPLLASWMGGVSMKEAERVLNEADIPTFAYADEAARAFNHMWRYSHNLQLLYETPALADLGDGAPDHGSAAEIIDAARRSSRTLLTEHESKAILRAYGIPVVESRLARSEREALEAASSIGYPVVLKLHSETITHKTDVGGVQLDLRDAASVRKAYAAIEKAVNDRAGPGHFQGVNVQPMVDLEGIELIVGSSIDAQFGPVLLFGAGGELVEVFRDQSVSLPPLTSTLARRWMERTRIYKALQGVRGRGAVDRHALESLLVRFSRLVLEQPRVKECDINPLLASPERLLALDARFVLHDVALPDERLPRPAIRPYPKQLTRPWKLRDGSPVTIRPICPEDEPLMVRFHEQLSERSVQMRYFNPFKLSQRTAHDRLTRLCFIDYDRELALVAEKRDASSVPAEIIAIGRLSKLRRRDEAEFALLVADRWQGQGLGTEILRQLVEFGRTEKLHRICAEMLSENVEMQGISKKLGFRLERSASGIRAEIDL